MEKNQPHGHIALPQSGSGPGVLVLHAWWGLNDTIKAFCDRLAEAGFVAFAPDLYHGKIATTIPEAEALRNALDGKHMQAKAEIAESTKYVRERSRQEGIAVIGFSLGAYYALDLSAADPEHIHSVVIYYGSGPAEFSKAKAEYLGHFAEKDDFEPAESVNEFEQTIKAAGRTATFHRYPGAEHWFAEPDRPQYKQAAADLAWERTLAFLKRNS